jgi:hypothetical protein
LSKGKESEQALKAAGEKWEGSDFNRGESEDLNYRVCFEHADPLDDEFERRSKMVFDPILGCEEKI